jgi:1-acyl-sn-glycerol-3-phosphate acyltransferase
VVVFKVRAPSDDFFIAHVRGLAFLHARLFFALRVCCRQGDPLPPDGPAIVVANHRSGVDPVVLSLATRRRIRFLMAREYYEIRPLYWLFRALGCIPVNRDGKDLGATKAALRALQNGEVIGIFPQGGIREGTSAIEEGKSGVALLALKTGAPIVPFFIEGTPNFDSVLRAFFSRSRSVVICGEPLRFPASSGRKPAREELEEVTARILQSIASLRPGAAGGAPATVETPPLAPPGKQ